MKRNGFTLIELMIVIAILGILVSMGMQFFSNVGQESRSVGMQSPTNAPSTVREQCVGGVKVMFNANGDSYQLKDAKGNGIAC